MIILGQVTSDENWFTIDSNGVKYGQWMNRQDFSFNISEANVRAGVCNLNKSCKHVIANCFDRS